MSTHVYLNWKTNFNSKNSRKRSFACETKASILFIPMRRMCLWCPNMKGKEIITWTHDYLNWKMNFNPKNGRKSSFFYEYKASISLIPMRRMCLWCSIMNVKEIIMSIRVCQNQQMSINSKNGRNKSFSYETKASISFIPMRKLCLWCLIMKRKEVIMWI